MATSQNGWAVRTSSTTLRDLPWITGRVRRGAVWWLFNYLCERFDDEVEPIRRDHSWGWAYRPIRGQSSGFSNHASGTAIDLNAPAHPLGKRGTFSDKQVAAIRRILADLDGVVRWGGDYSGRADEMHFEIVGTSAQVAAVAKSLRRKPTPLLNNALARDTDAAWRRLAAKGGKGLRRPAQRIANLRVRRERLQQREDQIKANLRKKQVK